MVGTIDERREAIRKLAEEAQLAWARISPEMLMSIIREGDEKSDELSKLQTVIGHLSMAARDLLNAAKTRGMGPDPDTGKWETREQDENLFHQLDVALGNYEAMKRYRTKIID